MWDNFTWGQHTAISWFSFQHLQAIWVDTRYMWFESLPWVRNNTGFVSSIMETEVSNELWARPNMFMLLKSPSDLRDKSTNQEPKHGKTSLSLYIQRPKRGYIVKKCKEGGTQMDRDEPLIVTMDRIDRVHKKVTNSKFQVCENFWKAVDPFWSPQVL